MDRVAERLWVPMSWQPCCNPVWRYGTKLWTLPLSGTVPDTPCATLRVWLCTKYRLWLDPCSRASNEPIPGKKTSQFNISTRKTTTWTELQFRQIFLLHWLNTPHSSCNDVNVLDLTLEMYELVSRPQQLSMGIGERDDFVAVWLHRLLFCRAREGRGVRAGRKQVLFLLEAK